MSKNKIPTAEKFWLQNNGQHQNIAKIMVDFAKLHVKAALEAALEDSPHGSSTNIPSYENNNFKLCDT